MRISNAIAAAAAAHCLVAISATAQRPDSARDTARVAPVVVTATGTPLARDRVPASVTVLDGATLRAQGLTHLADALREVPGMAIVQSGSYGAPTSLFTRGGQNNYTKVLIDGVPLNDPGGTLDLGFLTLDDVERIEIVRGPASMLYGSDAVSGVVQIFTRHGSATPRGALDARAGTFSSYDADGSVSGPVGPVQLSVDGGHHASNGIYQFNSRYRNDVGSASITATPWAGADLRANGRYDDALAHFPTDFTGAPVDPNAYRTEKRTLLDAELRQRAGIANMRLGLTSNLADAASIDPPNGPGDFGSSFLTHTVRQAADLRVAVPVLSLAALTVGGTLERQHEGSPDADRHNGAGYVELLRSTSVTTLTGGARLDHSSTYGDFGTYRVSLERVLPAALRLRGTLGTAFREPSFAESFDTPFSMANPALRPERTTSWEAGLEHDVHDGALTLGATYFHQRFVDMIDYSYNAATPSRSEYENIAQARAAGVEAEARVAPVQGVSADASYTWLDTRILHAGFDPSPDATLAQGGPLLRRPKHSGSVGLRYARPDGLAATARATYVGERPDRLFHGAPTFDTEPVTLHPYTKLDLSLLAPLGRISRELRPIDLTFRIDNALDTHYESVAGYATPGRTFLLGARASF